MPKPQEIARLGQGLWDSAFEQVVEQLMGAKKIDDKELLSYILTHAQSFDLYDKMYRGNKSQAIKDAREFLTKMPFRPEYASEFSTHAVARLQDRGPQ